MTTSMLSAHSQHAPAQLASIRLSTPAAAGHFAALEGKKPDFRSDPEPSGLTRGELRQIVLDILG
ncbi:hypothetical protein [Azospirillum sp. B510]|uniref:hypothetical protein n=1 Tax=Alphaproteobacteria TaxID=28211 RepID=UPI000304EA18|nr:MULTISPECIES: hypothetical protein [Alphaproteobacteria]